MGKLLLILAVVLVLLWWARPRRASKPVDQAEVTPQVEDMVRCEQCGVHLPRAEAVSVRDRHFCSAAHLALHERASGADGRAQSRDDAR
jgi:uncharacterized protein